MLLSLLVQLCIYSALMLIDDYLGTLLALIGAFISSAILVIALLVEWVSPSRVSRRYYWLMASGVLAPVTSLLIYWLLRGELHWLN